MKINALAVSVGVTMFWIWLTVVVLGVAGYLLWQRWRRRHPVHKPKPPPVQSYSQTLQQRLASGAQGKRKRPRRGPHPSESPPP